MAGATTSRMIVSNDLYGFLSLSKEAIDGAWARARGAFVLPRP
ncbi:MAG: hypothetical protein U9Q74_02565 [Gemmatimonadota bacterium]|nr:hypothetical protein [Gemmatimonadota bacterium]